MAKDTASGKNVTEASNEPIIINIHMESAAYEPPAVQAQREKIGPAVPQLCACDCGSRSGAGGGSGRPPLVAAE
jgi:hypothetical protein